MAAVQEQHISWHVRTHEHKEHSADWYWGLGLLALAGTGASIYFGNILLAAILFLGGVCIGFLSLRGPREHTVRIDKRGVSVDGTLHPYGAIRSFWVDDGSATDILPGGREPRLYLGVGSFLAPYIAVPLDSPGHVAQVRAYLKRSVHEEEQSPHIGEYLAQLLGL